MSIRAATPADAAAIESVVAAAFEEPVDGRVVQMMRALDRYEATRLSLVATEDEEVVGHVRLSRAWLDTRAALVEVLTLTPLAVAPQRHGEGIGTALIAAGLAGAEEAGFPAVFLEGDWNYYGPRGFQAAIPLGFQPPSERIPGRGFQVALLGGYQPGAPCRAVYPEALWVAGCVGLRDPELAEIEAALSE